VSGGGTIERKGSQKRARTAFVGAALVALTLLAYAGVGGHEFVNFDDGDYVKGNPHVRAGLTLDGVAWAFTTFHSANWHPLTWLSHMLDAELFGLDAGAHHRTNAALHALNALLCFLALRALTRATWPGALAAALFALHPLRVQSVAWVSERKDLLAALFFFLGLLAYVRYARAPRLGRYVLVFAALAAGLAAKPTAVVLPPVLLLVDLWPLERFRRTPWGRLVLEKLPLFLLVLLSSAVTVAAQRASGALGSFEALPLDARVSNALVAYATYLGRTLWPAGLAFFQPHPAFVDPGWSAWNLRALGAAVLVAGLGALALHQRRRRPYLLFGWLWFLGTLVPMIGLVQVGEQSWAERYTYLSLVGVYLAAALGAAELAGTRPGLQAPIVAAAGAVLVACFLRTRVEVAYWRDSYALYDRALAVTERNYVAHAGLANLLRRDGRREEARREYEEALAIKPDFAPALYSYGLFHQDEGRLEQAIELYERALEAYPALVLARVNLGGARAELGDYEGALADLALALDLAPDHPDAHFNLALIAFRRGDDELAREHVAPVVRAYPDYAKARTLLGVLDERAGRRAQAVRHLRIVCAGSEPPDNAVTRLAWILATAPEDDLRDAGQALALSERAVAATRGRDADALEARAAALAEAGRFDDAAAVQERALALVPAGRRAALLRRLELYRDGKPFRSQP